MEEVVDDDFGAGDLDDLGAVDAEIASAETFEQALADVNFLDVHRFNFGGKVIHLADFVLANGNHGLAQDFKMELHDISQADKILDFHKYRMVVDDEALGHNIADILIKQHQLAFLFKTILAIKALDFKVVGINDRCHSGGHSSAGAQTEHWAVKQ